MDELLPLKRPTPSLSPTFLPPSSERELFPFVCIFNVFFPSIRPLPSCPKLQSFSLLSQCGNRLLPLEQRVRMEGRTVLSHFDRILFCNEQFHSRLVLYPFFHLYVWEHWVIMAKGFTDQTELSALEWNPPSEGEKEGEFYQLAECLYSLISSSIHCSSSIEGIERSRRVKSPRFDWDTLIRREVSSGPIVDMLSMRRPDWIRRRYGSIRVL